MVRHALTFDVEDWYHVENLRPASPPESWAGLQTRLDANVDTLLGLCAGHRVRATFFVLGIAAERCPAAIRRIAEAGHEIASHGWSHELIYRQSPEVFREETRRSKRFLEDLTGSAVTGYRASTFSVTKRTLWALDIIAGEGFAYDSSIAPVRHDRYGIPDAPRDPHRRGGLIEFPVSVGRFAGVRVPLGGGFFRLLPVGWTRRALQAHERRGMPGMIYLHPWEFDPHQPRVHGIRWLPRFRHYHGLAKSGAKLAQLLDACRFATVGEALRGVM